MSESTWIGLDVHAESITAAILHGERDQVVLQPFPYYFSSTSFRVRRSPAASST
jgi:hypothetical protein